MYGFLWSGYQNVVGFFIWKLKCSPKLWHFVCQVISGTIPVAKNLKARGIGCDIRCSICGAEEESINHVLFGCPLQTSSLSKIPFRPPPSPGISQLLHTIIDYLFWRFPKEYDFSTFLWILWYILKNKTIRFLTTKMVTHRKDFG